MRVTRRLILLVIFLLPAAAWSLEINGFNTASEVMVENTVVRVGAVDSPVRALDSVTTKAIADSGWHADDFVMGVAINDEARAYPLAMMVWHQLVNDELGGIPVLITFCRICGTGLVYDRVVGEKALTFGMSGLVYQADVLLYDKETKSLWSRFLDEAVSGPSQGEAIFDLPFEMTTLGDWQERYPDSTIISSDTGFDINYSVTPTGTSSMGENIFTTLPTEMRYYPGMPVVGVSRDGNAKVYPAGEVLVNGGKVIEQFAGADVSIEYSASGQSFTHNIDESLQVQQTTWSDWANTHPQTAIFTATVEAE